MRAILSQILQRITVVSSFVLFDWLNQKKKENFCHFKDSSGTVCISGLMELWILGNGERERERDFVLYFTASFCLNILYYLAYGTETEFKIIPLRTFDGQITHLIFGHNLLSVKKNVNTFALKFKYCFIYFYTEFYILRRLIQSKMAITIQPFWIVS